MFKFIKNKINSFLNLTNTENITTEIKENIAFEVSFPNTPKTKEESIAWKNKREKLIFEDFHFWNKLQIDNYADNKDFYINSVCPYCKNKIEQRKSTSFKCSSCSEKIYRKKDFLTYDNLLLTTQEIQDFENSKNEYIKRKKVLEIYQYFQKIIIPVPSYPKIGSFLLQKYTDNKEDNLKLFLDVLDCGFPEYFDKKYISDLRMCLFYAGEVYSLYGFENKALNAYMKVLFIDLLGDYCKLYSDSNYSKKELDEDGFSEWGDGFVAPGIYKRVQKLLQDNVSFEECFTNNANELLGITTFNPPLTPQSAMTKLLKLI